MAKAWEKKSNWKGETIMLESKAFREACGKVGINIADYCQQLTVEGYRNQPTENYVHFIIVERLNDYTIFTQDGQNILVVETMDVINGDKIVTRGVQFIRKITATLRRKSKSLLRTYAPEVVSLGDDGRMAGMKMMGKLDPDDALFGFAVGDGGSNKDGVAFAGKSRVKTGSSFTIRPISPKLKTNVTFNAQSDETRIGEPSTALGEKEYFLPDVVFPMIITLQDPAEEDILYLMHVIDRCKRTGAVSNRNGRSEYIVAGIAFNHDELPSNLEISQKMFEMIGDRTVSDDELNDYVLEAVASISKEKRLNVEKMLVGNDVYSMFDDVFANDEAVASWINVYANLYQKILATMDARNAPQTKKTRAYIEKELPLIIERCDEAINARGE